MSRQFLARGMGASPGTASGRIVFHSRDAVALTGAGTSVIFVRIETTAEDVPGLKAAAGIITTRGGITGDAAIVARSLGKPCISSCSAMSVDYSAERLTILHDSSLGEKDVVLHKGDVVTIDGAKGDIWAE